MKKCITLFMLLQTVVLQSSQILYESFEYSQDSKKQFDSVRKSSQELQMSLVGKFGEQVGSDLQEGTVIKDPVAYKLSEKEVDFIKLHMTPLIVGRKLKTAYLPYWLTTGIHSNGQDVDFENVNHTYTQEKFGTVTLGDYLARYREGGYHYGIKGTKHAKYDEWNKNQDIQEYLENLTQKFDDSARDFEGVVARGDTEEVTRYIQQGVDYNYSGWWIPLILAIINRQESVIDCLIKAGADKEAKNEYGQTPLIVAAAHGYKLGVDYLIAAGSNKDARDEDGCTPLMVAAGGGYESIVKSLIEVGADKEVKNKAGNTVLMLAAGGGHESIVKYLIELGSDKEVSYQDYYTSVKIADYNGHTSVVKYLMEVLEKKMKHEGYL